MVGREGDFGRQRWHRRRDVAGLRPRRQARLRYQCPRAYVASAGQEQRSTSCSFLRGDDDLLHNSLHFARYVFVYFPEPITCVCVCVCVLWVVFNVAVIIVRANDDYGAEF